MHIFIDESGNFRRDAQKEHCISCVAAVVIPGRFLSDIEREFAGLTEKWPKASQGEIKGRLLNEDHIAALCGLLRPMHVLVEASVMDMNLSTDEEVRPTNPSKLRG